MTAKYSFNRYLESRSNEIMDEFTYVLQNTHSINEPYKALKDVMKKAGRFVSYSRRKMERLEKPADKGLVSLIKIVEDEIKFHEEKTLPALEKR